MTRRRILRAIAGAATAAISPIALSFPFENYFHRKSFGRIETGGILQNGQHRTLGTLGFRVFVDGMEVTNAALRADDIEDFVDCYQWEGCPNPPGESPKFLVVDGSRRGRWVWGFVGKVEIRYADPVPSRLFGFLPQL